MQDGRLGSSGLALLCGLIFVSAGVTLSLGLHAILGAFVAGAVLPRRLSGTLVDQLQLVVISVLMPFYFILAGLKAVVDFGAAEFWQVFIATTACAVIGKLGGTAIAARSAGENLAGCARPGDAGADQGIDGSHCDDRPSGIRDHHADGLLGPAADGRGHHRRRHALAEVHCAARPRGPDVARSAACRSAGHRFAAPGVRPTSTRRMAGDLPSHRASH